MRTLRGHWQLLLLTAAVFLLWQTPAILPLKLLVVFFHEASHAIATFVTGGEVVSLQLSAHQGGHVVHRGGDRFWILTAGYIGSLLIGVFLLLAATRSKADREVMGFCGIVTLVIAGLYVREGFALLFVVGAGVTMLLVARFLSHNFNDLILRVIGLTSMIYVPYDIFSDTIVRSGLRSDARIMAEEIGGTPQMWGVLWLAISVITIGFCVRSILGRNSNLRLR